MYSSNILRIHVVFIQTEPVGSVAPKVNDDDELKSARVRLTHTFSMACRAQAYPTPVFRYVFNSVYCRRRKCLNG